MEVYTYVCMYIMSTINSLGFIVILVKLDIACM